MKQHEKEQLTYKKNGSAWSKVVGRLALKPKMSDRLRCKEKFNG